MASLSVCAPSKLVKYNRHCKRHRHPKHKERRNKPSLPFVPARILSSLRMAAKLKPRQENHLLCAWGAGDVRHRFVPERVTAEVELTSSASLFASSRRRKSSSLFTLVTTMWRCLLPGVVRDSRNTLFLYLQQQTSAHPGFWSEGRPENGKSATGRSESNPQNK